MKIDQKAKSEATGNLGNQRHLAVIVREEKGESHIAQKVRRIQGTV